MPGTIILQGITLEQFREVISTEVSKKLAEFNLSRANRSELLGRLEAAKLLKISPLTLDSWNKKKILTARKIGGKVYYDRDQIESVLNS